jgi:hypothetical protein
MGKRGPLPRAPGALHGRSKPKLALLEGSKFDPGEPPFPNQAHEWETFWDSPGGQACQPADLPVVLRLFTLRAHFDAAIGQASQEPRVEGSKGQMRPNPFYDTALKLDMAVVRLENELGLTPKARAALGLTVSQATLTVQQINERMAASLRPVDSWEPGRTHDLEADGDVADESGQSDAGRRWADL